MASSPPPTPAPTIKRGIGEFSPTAAFQLEKNLQHARYLVAAGMPLLLGLRHFLRNNFFSPENYGLLGLQIEEDQYWRGGGRHSVGCKKC